MAQVDPKDIDVIEGDFDNKENTFQHSNVLSRTPCTEKGYEELDVSELNMKLRYSITPASSPMSKSVTGLCLDNRNCNLLDDYLNNTVTENGNLTRSLHSTFTKSENITKTKVLPLQTLSADSFVDGNRNSSARRMIDTIDDNEIKICMNLKDMDDNMSLPSTSSSVAHTPEATTPTKEIPKPEGSPILRGLKSVLSMFRPSHSPIPPANDQTTQQDLLSQKEVQLPHKNESDMHTILASTPVSINRQKGANSSRRSSPLKEKIVFNDDLERELQWKNETEKVNKQEIMPIHKLMNQHQLGPEILIKSVTENLNSTEEYMDTSCTESTLPGATVCGIEKTIDLINNNEAASAVESDNDFVDCESTFSKNESCISDFKEMETRNMTQVINNLTSNSIEDKTLAIYELESKNNAKNPECIDSINDSHILLSQNQNVSFHDEMQINIQDIQQETFNTRPVENLTIGNAEESLNPVNNVEETKVNKVIVDLDAIKPEENSHSLPLDEVSFKIDNLLNESTSTLNTIEDSETILSAKNQTKDYINSILNNNAGFDMKVNEKGDSLFGDKKEVESVDMVISSSNNEGPIVPDNFENIHDLQLHTATDYLKSQNNLILDSNFGVDNLMLNDAAVNFINNDVEILDSVINHKSKEDIYVLESINNEHAVANANVNFDTKLTTVQSNLNTDLNTKIDSDPKQFEIKNQHNQSNIDINQETYTLNMSLSENVESEIDVTKTSDTSSHTELKLIGKDRELPEISVQNDLMTRQPPSEIPLPIEDEIKNAVTECNDDIKYKQAHTIIVCDMSEKHTIHAENTIEPTAMIKNSVATIPTNIVIDNVLGYEITVDSSKPNNTQPDIPLNETDTKMNISTPKNFDNGLIEIHTKNVLLSGTDNITEYDSLDNGEVAEKKLLENYNTTNYFGTGEGSDNVHIENNKICDESEEAVNVDTLKKVTEYIQHIPEEMSDEKINLEDSDKANYNDNVEILEESNVNKQTLCPNDIVIDTEVIEEIVTSANNSPYVSVTDLLLDTRGSLKDSLEEIDNPFAAKTKIALSPPACPKTEQGYNFNFDEIIDPFATNTKIRMSPTIDTPNQSSVVSEKEVIIQERIPNKLHNRQKLQSERKNSPQNKKINSKYTRKENKSKQSPQKWNVEKSRLTDNISTTTVLNSVDLKTQDVETLVAQKNELVSECVDVKVDNKCNSNSLILKVAPLSSQKDEVQLLDEEIYPMVTTIHPKEGDNKCLLISNEKSTSSSEQYYSLGTSSCESVSSTNRSKNVFNLPEIDDINFNTLSIKSRMSPLPPIQNAILPIEGATNSSYVLEQNEDNNITTINTKTVEPTIHKVVRKDSSPNTSSGTYSSNDKDATVREILTEDDDTIEGPFLEDHELKVIDKCSDMNINSDLNNFDKMPLQEKEEREDANIENGELFIDADAFEFLLNQNKSTTVAESGKESLFLKFDPLFAKRSSDGVLAALSKVQKRQSTPKTITTLENDLTNVEIPVIVPSIDKEINLPNEDINEDTFTATKPMMVVNPAVSSIISTRKCNSTPKLNRRSLTFTSPAIAVIDRLLSLSGNSSTMDHDTSAPNIYREHVETDFAITHLRELLAEKEIHVHNLRTESKDLKDRLATLEGQVRSLETVSNERLTKINELNERLSEKTKTNKSMASVVEEYERTIASLIAETEHDKKRNAEERMRLIKERDEQTAHLTSMEVSFSDLHSKYEKSKQIILSCKANEDIYKKSLEEFEENISKLQNNYELLKQHATSKLNHANQELEKMNRAHDVEVLKLNAMIKRKELHITNLQETLNQKIKANEELTAICDELINKVG